jgi:hypothetical protein
MATQLTANTTNAVARINRMPIGALNLLPRSLDAWLGQPVWARTTAALPGRYATLPVPYQTVSTKQITMACWLVCSSSDHVRALEDLRRALMGKLELSTSDTDGTVLWAHCTGITVEGLVPERPFMDDSLAVTLTFTCYDAARYRQHPTLYVVTSTQPVRVAMGDLSPVAQYVHRGALAGALTLTWRGASGIALETLTITATLSSTERLVVDLTGHSCVRYDAAGVPTTLLVASVVSGTFPTLAARDAAYAPRTEPESWPTFEVSTGAGVLMVREAWSV